jgi:lipid-A-disaccharide synthase-like uncharacterized protein
MIYNLIGFIGSTIFVVTYILLQKGKMNPYGRGYNLWQIVAAVCITISVSPYHFWHIYVLEGVVVIYGTKSIFKTTKTPTKK